MSGGERGEIFEQGAGAVNGTGKLFERPGIEQVAGAIKGTSEEISLPKKRIDAVNSFDNYSELFMNKKFYYKDSDGNEIILTSTKTSISIYKTDISGKKSIYTLNHPDPESKFTLTFGYIGKESTIPKTVEEVLNEVLPKFETRYNEFKASANSYAQNAQKEDDEDVERLEHLFEEMV